MVNHSIEELIHRINVMRDKAVFAQQVETNKSIDGDSSHDIARNLLDDVRAIALLIANDK
tara:strand:- start:3419 stop:3598 length:180 start_codon:yes stop_codon:yes gene_type:complete